MAQAQREVLARLGPLITDYLAIIALEPIRLELHKDKFIFTAVGSMKNRLAAIVPVPWPPEYSPHRIILRGPIAVELHVIDHRVLPRHVNPWRWRIGGREVEGTGRFSVKPPMVGEKRPLFAVAAASALYFSRLNHARLVEAEPEPAAEAVKCSKTGKNCTSILFFTDYEAYLRFEGLVDGSRVTRHVYVSLDKAGPVVHEETEG